MDTNKLTIAPAEHHSQELIKVHTSNHKKKDLPPFVQKYPKHCQDLWFIFNNNAELRRFVSHSIINSLKSQGVFNENYSKVFVCFGIGSFSVVIDGNRTKHRYTEPLFCNCFLAGITSFIENANLVLDNFFLEETGCTIDEIKNDEEVNQIVLANSNILSNSPSI